jgi:hypothetical protein
MLRELIGQDFDIDHDGVQRLHQGTRSDRILSVIDPEMRLGRKSPQARFNGFKLHAAATTLLTAIEITGANLKDGAAAEALICGQPPHRRPPRVLSDAAYGHGPIRAQLAEHGIEASLISPALRRAGRRCPKRPLRSTATRAR